MLFGDLQSSWRSFLLRFCLFSSPIQVLSFKCVAFQPQSKPWFWKLNCFIWWKLAEESKSFWFGNQHCSLGSENNGSRGVARLTSNLSLKLGLGPNTGKDEKTETRLVRNCAGGRPPLPPLSIMPSIIPQVQCTLVDRVINEKMKRNPHLIRA